MKLLIVQTGFLGDVVLSTPVISALKEEFPNAEISVLTTPGGAEILRNDPVLKSVFVYDKRGNNSGIGGLRRIASEILELAPNRIYCLHKSFRTCILMYLVRSIERVGFRSARIPWVFDRTVSRTGNHDVLRNLSILSTDVRPKNLSGAIRVFPPAEEALSKKIKEVISNEENLVIIAPGSVWATKRWTVNGYSELASDLVRNGYKVIITGSPEESDIAVAVAKFSGAVSLAGELNIGELMYAISKAKVVVCNDSLPLHLASGLKIPTVAIFCATVPEFGFGPWQNVAKVLEVADLPCRPCGSHGGKYCPTGTEACMKNISSAQVIAATHNIMSTSRANLREIG